MNSGNDNNLLTFLKKNSLFTNSPTKNARKSKSRSKDKLTDSKFTPSKDPYQEETRPRPFFPEQTVPADPPRFVPLQTNNMKQGPALKDSRFDDLTEERQLVW